MWDMRLHALCRAVEIDTHALRAMATGKSQIVVIAAHVQHSELRQCTSPEATSRKFTVHAHLYRHVMIPIHEFLSVRVSQHKQAPSH